MSKNIQPTILRHLGFELLCKPNTLALFREGKLGRDKVVIVDEIFKNSKKGDKASTLDLEKAFGTGDVNSCITIMLEQGEYQISAEERKKKVDEKRSEIMNYIYSNFTDEKGITIPMTRVELALEEMKVRIDGDTPTDKQLKPILKKLPDIMRIKKRKGVHAVFKIKHQYLGRCQSLIQTNATVLSERYVSQGAIIEVNLVPHQMDMLLETIGNITAGDFKFEVLGENE